MFCSVSRHTGNTVYGEIAQMVERRTVEPEPQVQIQPLAIIIYYLQFIIKNCAMLQRAISKCGI